MAFVHGKDSYFELETIDLTPFLTDISVSQSADVAESSVMGLENKTYVEGLKDATISISGRYDSTASTGPDDLLRDLTGEADFIYGPEGETATKPKVSGVCIKTAYVRTSSIGDVVAFSAEFQITGAVTEGAFA